MDGGAWWATLVHGVTKSQTRLSNFTSLSHRNTKVYHLGICSTTICLLTCAH